MVVIRSHAWALACLSVLLHGGTSAGSPRAKLAVMSIADRSGTLPPALLDALTDALRTQLAQAGRYVIIDKSRQAEALRRLVKDSKAESYKDCYDTRCQIPLGQAVAADTIARTTLSRIGTHYVLALELVDLAKEAVTQGAQVTIAVEPASSRDDRLLRAVQDVARRLGAPTTRPPTPSTPPSVPSAPLTFRTADLRHDHLTQTDATYRRAHSLRRFGLALAIVGGGLGIAALVGGAMAKYISGGPGADALLYGGLVLTIGSVISGTVVAVVYHGTMARIRRRYPIVISPAGVAWSF